MASITRKPAQCELGRVTTTASGREEVEFTDLTGRTCKLMQTANAASLALKVGDSFAVLPRNQVTALVLTLGRWLERGTFVDAGDEL